jgi:hypothetical protein
VPLLEELAGPHPPPLQRGEVSFHTLWMTQIVLDNDRVNLFTILGKHQ